MKNIKNEPSLLASSHVWGFVFYSTSLKLISLGLYSSAFNPTRGLMYSSSSTIVMKAIHPTMIDAWAVSVNVSNQAPKNDTRPVINPSIR